MPWIRLPTVLTRGRRGAYVSTFSAMVLAILCGGPFMCFGALFVPIRHNIGGSATEIGWVGSLAIGMISITSPIRLYLCNRFSHRSVALVGVLMCSMGLLTSSLSHTYWLLFPCYSVMCGLGGSFAHIGSVMLVDKLFTGRFNAIATTFACFGMGIGTICFGPLFEVLQAEIGLRNTLRCLSLLQACLGIPLCLILTTPQTDPLHKLDDLSQINYMKQFAARMSDARLWRDPLLVLWVFGCCVWFMALCFPYVHLISYVESVSPESRTSELALITAVMGGGEIVSRIVVIMACWYLPWPHSYLYPIVCSIAASWNFILPHLSDKSGFIIYAACSGMCYGFTSPGLYRTNKDLFGLELYESAYAINLVLLGVGSIAGPVIAGAIYDKSNSYKTAFYMAAIASVVAAVIFMTMVTIHRSRAQVLTEYSTSNKYIRRKSSTIPLVTEEDELSSRRTSATETSTSTDSAIDIRAIKTTDESEIEGEGEGDGEDEEGVGLLENSLGICIVGVLEDDVFTQTD